jgi:hypothetical protein
MDKANVSKVYSDSNAGTPFFCFEPGDLRDSKVCFDTATGEIISLHNRWGRGTIFSASLDESDFIGAGNIRYPRQFVRRTKDETIEVYVENLEIVANFAADAFLPPANSTVRDWCPHPSIKPGSEFPIPFPKIHPPTAFLPSYIPLGQTATSRSLSP